jgi:multiple antibiotic resistance protein
MLDNAFTDFVTLWVTVDPIGTVPLFLSVADASSPRELRRTATQGVLVAAGVLLGFLVLGQFLLNAMGITIHSFQIAGGLILFKLGLSMIFAGHTAHGAGPDQGGNVAIFPLAMPFIAGPGAILAVVVLTDNDRFSVLEQTRTAIVLLVVLLAQWILLMAANPIRRRLGMNPIGVLSRVMGMILAALSVETVIGGIKDTLRAWHT